MTKPKKKAKESVEAYNKRACKLYHENGYLIKEITTKLKLTEVDVYNYLSNNSITTEEERERMIKLRDQGLSIRAIAKEVGRSKTTVRTRLESPAKVNCSCKSILNDRQMNLLSKMAKDGCSIREIAKALNMDMSSLKYRISIIDKKTSTPTRVTNKEIKRFIKLYKSGKSCSKIANICGRNETTVRKYLKQEGYM